jgi:hypothetical protein
MVQMICSVVDCKPPQNLAFCNILLQQQFAVLTVAYTLACLLQALPTVAQLLSC